MINSVNSALWTDMSIEELEQRMEFGVIGPFVEPCGRCDVECGTQCGCHGTFCVSFCDGECLIQL